MTMNRCEIEAAAKSSPRRNASQWFASVAESMVYHLVWVVVSPIVGIPTFIYGRRFQQRMQRAGRFLVMRDARQRIAEMGGTVIIEMPLGGIPNDAGMVDTG